SGRGAAGALCRAASPGAGAPWAGVLMPPLRKPINRDRRRPISPEWAEKFRRLCELSRDYDELHRLRQELYVRFAIPPWRSHLFPDDLEAPRGLNERELSAWWLAALAAALRDTLDEASG